MFEQELRLYVGNQVQVITPVETNTGVLLNVSEAAAVVRTAQYPGYGGSEDVAVRLSAISYVRVMV